MYRARHYGRAAAAITLLAAAAASTLAIGPTIDGKNIPTDFGGGALLVTQRFTTGFGDHFGTSQFGSGSELDQMFVTNDHVYLYVGISGNLENNGNCIVLFIDVDGPTSGANPLYTRNVFGANEPLPGLPRYLTGDPPDADGLNDITFDPGFAPDIVFGFSGGSPLGGQTRTYYLLNATRLGDSVADPNDPNEALDHTSQVLGLMTAGDPTASGSNGTLGQFYPGSSSKCVQAAMDNSNPSGVNGTGGGDLVDPNLPPTATTGLEIRIPRGMLPASNGQTISVFAMVSSPDGYMSNQFLPTDTALISLGNQAFAPYDFNDLVGDQYVAYTVVAGNCPNDPTGTACDGDNNGDCVVENQDLQAVLDAWNATTNDPDYSYCADYNDDGIVENFDLQQLLDDWGHNCN
jgi:hypothetical protein